MQSWSSVSVPRIPGVASPLSLFDAATREVRLTEPGQIAKIYVCGITPYDATHLGHAATYLAFDLVQRVWLDNGHDIHYVQNVTDIDDPLLERAARDNVDWSDLAQTQIQLFRDDMAALRVLPPREYVGAVEAMDEVSAAVAALLENGAAYRLSGDEYEDVYFDIRTSGRFGYESGYNEETMTSLFGERGGDPDRVGKRNRLDPLLWRLERAGEPAWDSPVGRGRPGWHIECAAIAGNRIGPSIDVQGGGSDLIYPHHEYSAAHAESLSGVHPFARHYTHAGMIGLDGEKMSKSRGNLVFVSKLRYEGVDPMAIRLALLSGHYRADRLWTADLLIEAGERLTCWRAAATRVAADASAVVASLRAAMAQDLDTPKAIAVIDEWAANPDLDGWSVAMAVDALLGITLAP
ncbi:cysteine--1-D-myo-inosityl 2-amino-2-deoxy-alpha-D-glucopyranoside ligase [Nakamurella antarctica]|uniref:L-cysteine:1D-myo-inositol 2-amino-2-deoxy-alpha-D-glucopyranoside ligase n=1 Tax=Nakamurella antarctica TaxID=1902245 RepID=A0A3G8ZL78_9ACTN|nr:cysteine--1-D-myo-inosityl 2-amino-2-deoxy-alpha-D-glucopyranoside ligase [Nakamurella antarctica]AZI57960.1 cysteine--1-D-myo-inosityl 2-amino-2-deoxy-alpha-D-glucopyranoside ligase [Nakamurella antarctica]